MGIVEVQLHTLRSLVDGNGHLHVPATLPRVLDAHWTGGSVGLIHKIKETSLCLCQEWNPDSLVVIQYHRGG
jgi:uncharacterized protein (DUF2267 family)